MTNAKRFDSADFDKEWMKQFVDDPFLLYDETLPIDLYETSTEYIIEADLSRLNARHLDMTFSGYDFKLAVKTDEQHYEKSLMLPFFLNDKQIEAEWENSILAVKINKEASQDEVSLSFHIPFISYMHNKQNPDSA
ncbi:Spore coat protein M [Bacillus paralicheniformis]|uniref:Hsp20/alpha crystallin family protein n=1 Tax=Bacillus paralicheniformis TaxID=1648923 RepID=UPI0007414D37|nr:Hsp20/alpha crystallin family protein [Bacillus paralicheniformis]KUL17491.1 spore coat protein [Bacillus licheniformis LMG 6934]MBG9883333.1 spore coat protein [Bacillus paralicheniformis]MDE1383840.1 Hsp20/alpha crystallin family protein [Bacillus paralicheniformis]MDE1393291.1 Hsp20/alpha crystallin family protein [Bacillus paralicheniformis]MED0804329.1 Hsp20/alpha crystallin family protein [Bacillus paralicheniformis]